MIIKWLMHNFLFKKLTVELSEIQTNKEGINFRKAFDSIVKFYKWDDIKNIQFSSNYKNVVFDFNGKKIVLNNSTTGWYELIQNIPADRFTFDFKYAEALIKSLKSCEICGLEAVFEQKCLVCQNSVWNPSFDDEKLNYLQSKQLKLYSELLKENKTILNKPEHGFKSAADWKLLIEN